MLDLSYFQNSKEYFKVFYATDGLSWQTWVKPRKCNFIWIMCIGGGAGGTGGAGNGIATYAVGGASGGISKALYPAYALPDTLYVIPGTGSVGGAGQAGGSNTSSGSATRSFVSIAPSSATTWNFVSTSGSVAAAGPGAESVIPATPAAAPMLTTAVWTSTGGQIPTTAGVLSNLTPFTSSIVSAGSNGSGSGATAGMDISSMAIGTIVTPTIPGGAAGSNGNSGLWNWGGPFIYGLGGSGGGGVASGTAANGGNGAYGCGGGGGGNSASGTGGSGGKGGDGLVIIYTF